MHLLILWTSFKKVVLPDPEEPTTTVRVIVITVASVELHQGIISKHEKTKYHDKNFCEQKVDISYPRQQHH